MSVNLALGLGQVSGKFVEFLPPQAVKTVSRKTCVKSVVGLCYFCGKCVAGLVGWSQFNVTFFWGKRLIALLENDFQCCSFKRD